MMPSRAAQRIRRLPDRQGAGRLRRAMPLCRNLRVRRGLTLKEIRGHLAIIPGERLSPECSIDIEHPQQTNDLR